MNTPRKIDAMSFQIDLLDWYHKNKRYMAWREDPSPYHVWVSEIMLQQTRVEAVHAYYDRFMRRLPDIRSLSEVSEDELHKLWEGLGYYNRAKNMKKAAQLLMRDYGGELPSSFEELLSLPGIGPYTAGAIASIAFQRNVPAVDGNVMRVLARLTGDERDIAQETTRKAMEKTAQELLVLPGEIRHFNQALMELGALICLPNGAPNCAECPVRRICYACETARQAELPVKSAKKPRRIEERSILVFVDEAGKFFIRRRPSKGLLSGLWEFVSLDGKLTKGELEKFLSEREISFLELTKIESAKHIFTHIEWRMQGFLIRVKRRDDALFARSLCDSEDSRWVDYPSLKASYSIPTAFKSYLSSIEGGKIFQALH